MKPGDYFQSQEESAFDLAELFSFLWHKKFRIVFFTGLIVLAGAYYIFNLPKIYTASSTILLGDGEQNFRLSSGIPDFGGGDAKIDTYIEFFRSRQFIGNVVDALNLVDDPEFRPVSRDTTAEYARDHAISVVLGNLSLSRLGDTTLLKVIVNSKNPKTAAELANHLGPAFFAFQAEMGKEKADITSLWLNQQLNELQEKLASAEQTLQNFLVDNQLMDVNSQIQISQVEIAGLLQEKLAVEKVLAEVSATVSQIKLADSDVNQLIQIPWMLNNQLMVNIRRKKSVQEQMLAELSKRYKSKHHKHIMAVTSLDTLRKEEATLLQELIASLKQEFETLKLRKQSIKQQIDSAKKLHGELGKHELQLERMRRDVESTQTLYEVFLARLRETEILKDLGNTEQFAVVDFASVPVGPSKPRVALLMGLVLMFGFLASSGFWLVLHLISDKQSRCRQILRQLDVPILAELPKLGRSKISKTGSGAVREAHNNYPYAEAIRSLRTSVLVQHGEEEKRVIAITGVSGKNGKSRISISLAESFGKLEKTLLMDTNLRTPSIAKAFDLAVNHPGITNLLGRKVAFSKCLHRVKDMQLTVVPSGPIPTDPMAYISRQRFANIIKKLAVFYDRVIIETPPVNTYSDALIMSKYVDAIIIVCDADDTAPNDLLDAIQKLQDSGAPLLGAVFNSVKNLRHKTTQRSQAKRLLKRALGG
ncbi:MAG: succinoglycan biosynthesis transport protein ExoP [Paraglaciecola sp.]|jgi:succinoglycan biosynthesis transport protein ExoP